METRIEDINSLLKSKQYNAIAIYGMGGIGKTTLAQGIYNIQKHDFQRHSFISGTLEGTSKIVKILQSKKVLIVLDDIDDQDQLNNLLGTKVFHAESKIIITTRDRLIDRWFASASKSSGCKVHELNSLNDEESLWLFSLHAFPTKALMGGFEVLAKQLAQNCGGNPLALRVLGSSLCFSDEDLRKKEDIIESWTNKLNSLNSSKGNLDSQIQEVLRKSFDSLPLDRHRDLFLHIACFFVGELEEHVISILQDDLDIKFDIPILVNKCLLTVSQSGHFVMHQLLQEMGRTIVCGEDKDSAKRSRVWNDTEAYHVLEKGNGSDKIEGLSLDMEKVKQKDKEFSCLSFRA
ncbi:disease resistance protein RPV1-like [Bidens hawaiensis]|uniref:disease resistance protein RPV1-like n=1 Tax=Bidens hawaiensis TaxID=980011 RepID=UPI0040496A2C